MEDTAATGAATFVTWCVIPVNGVLSHVRDELLAMMLEEFSAGRLELNLVLNFSHPVFIRVTRWTNAMCRTRVDHDSVNVRAGIQSKDPQRALEVIVRNVRRDGDLSQRRGACHRRLRWNVRQSQRARRGWRRGQTVLCKRRLALLIIPLLLPAVGLGSFLSCDRGALDPGLEHGLADVVCDGLDTLFLVLPDEVSELFNPVDELRQLSEVIQEDLPEHADVTLQLSSARTVPRTHSTPPHLRPRARSAVSSTPHRSCSG